MIQLIFKKVGNHWYLDIPHDNPNDLILDRRLEFLLSKLDKWNEGKVSTVYLQQQTSYLIEDGLIQFTDQDLLRYFTTDDTFFMDLFIEDHKFKISSKLYFLLEKEYHLDLHINAYRILIF